jgi:murein DD-endopeptidase MepM/ murein hydrolase activator NlpD
MEVRVGDVPVNPGPYLNGGTVKAPMTDYVITQGFGVTPFSSIYAGGRHTGYDMAGPDGSRVSSPVSGTVIMNEAFGGYGHAWAVQMDNGLVILLAHLR